MRTLTVASSEAVVNSGGPLRMGQTLFTWLSCSDTFFTCTPVRASQALADLSAEQESSRSPSVLHATSSTAFLWPCGRPRRWQRACMST
jgi:hypothetical protein